MLLIFITIFYLVLVLMDDMDKSSMQIQKRQDTMYEEGVE